MNRYLLPDIKDNINRHYQRQFKKSFRMVLDDLEDKYLGGFVRYTHEIGQIYRPTISRHLVKNITPSTCRPCDTHHYGCGNERNPLIRHLKCIYFDGWWTFCHDCSVPYGNIRYGLTYTYPNKRDLERVLGKN